jgi:hypothetical protein
VIYLYPTEQAARDGDHVGGSGFLVSVAAPSSRIVHVYAVSNRHVVSAPGHSTVVRLNAQEGGMAAIRLDAEDWITHPALDDVAVACLGTSAAMSRYHWSAIPADLFVTRAMVEGDRSLYGPGSDCFMLGRLIAHDGRQQNLPTAQFGNISMLPAEQIRDGRGLMVDAFLVEMRSQSGYSGSPVFVYQSVWPVVRTSQLQHPLGARGTDLVAVETFRPHLLGIDFGHMPMTVVLRRSDASTADRDDVGEVVQMNWGVTTVVPAWKLAELLDSKDVAHARERGIVGS